MTSVWELISIQIMQCEGGFERVLMKVPWEVRGRVGHVHLESSEKDSNISSDRSRTQRKGRIGSSPGRWAPNEEQREMRFRGW